MKEDTAQLILKFPGADEATLERLKRLLIHYTGTLKVKTDCEAASNEDTDGALGLDAGPQTTTTAELTIKLTPAAAAWLIEKILDDFSFKTKTKLFDDAIQKAVSKHIPGATATVTEEPAKPRMKKGA